MDKIWFIAIEGKHEGPFSIFDLKRDPRVTPDTLVWRKGFEHWIPIRHVPELKDVFKDDPEAKPLHEETKFKPFPADGEPTTLTLQNDPFQYLLWVLAIILMILYLIYVFQS